MIKILNLDHGTNIIRLKSRKRNFNDLFFEETPQSRGMGVDQKPRNYVISKKKLRIYQCKGITKLGKVHHRG